MRISVYRVPIFSYFFQVCHIVRTRKRCCRKQALLRRAMMPCMHHHMQQRGEHTFLPHVACLPCLPDSILDSAVPDSRRLIFVPHAPLIPLNKLSDRISARAHNRCSVAAQSCDLVFAIGFLIQAVYNRPISLLKARQIFKSETLSSHQSSYYFYQDASQSQIIHELPQRTTAFCLQIHRF